MIKESGVATWICDCCQREAVIHGQGRPDGWAWVRIYVEGTVLDHLCPTCAVAIEHALVRTIKELNARRQNEVQS